MDSISRGCLLAYLIANPDMTYREIVEFIEKMQPMEIDGTSPSIKWKLGKLTEDLSQEEQGKILHQLSSLRPGDHLRLSGYEVSLYPLWPASMG